MEENTAARRVYVIDDDVDVRKSLHFLLASSSITAWPFAAANDFVDQLSVLAPAPILLDIRMVEMDGFELLTILRARDVSWPVIVITAHGDVSVAVRAMKLGAIEFIEKPFSTDMLEAALDQAFDLLERTMLVQRTRDHAHRLFISLTTREREIVDMLMKGTPNKLGAYRLGLSVRTLVTALSEQRGTSRRALLASTDAVQISSPAAKPVSPFQFLA